MTLSQILAAIAAAAQRLYDPTGATKPHLSSRVVSGPLALKYYYGVRLGPDTPPLECEGRSAELAALALLEAVQAAVEAAGRTP